MFLYNISYANPNYLNLYFSLAKIYKYIYIFKMSAYKVFNMHN